MRLGTAVFGNDGDDALVGVSDQLAGDHGGRDDDIGRRSFGRRGLVKTAHEPLADVQNIGRLVANHGNVALFERVVELDRDPGDGCFRRLQVLADFLLNPSGQLRIAQHRGLGRKDAGVLGATPLREQVPHAVQLASGPAAGRLQPFDLFVGVSHAVAGQSGGQPTPDVDNVDPPLGNSGSDAFPAEDHRNQRTAAAAGAAGGFTGFAPCRPAIHKTAGLAM